MKTKQKIPMILSVLLILTTLLTVGVSALPDPNQCTMSAKQATIVVDGVKDDYWDLTSSYTTKNKISTSNSGASATVKILYDTNHLYFWIDVVDGFISTETDWDTVTLKIGEGGNRKSDGCTVTWTQSGTDDTFSSEDYFVTLSAKTEGLQYVDTAYYNAGPWRFVNIPINVTYYVTHTETGYTMEVCYDFNHINERNSALKIVDKTISGEGTQEFTYVPQNPQTTAYMNKQISFDFILQDKPTAGTSPADIASYAFAIEDDNFRDYSAYWGWLNCSIKAVKINTEDDEDDSSTTTTGTKVGTKEVTKANEKAAVQVNPTVDEEESTSGCSSVAGGEIAVAAILLAGSWISRKKH